MIAASRLIKTAALAGAIALHGALAWAVMDRTEVQIEGSAGAQDTRLGTSFADMAAGTLEAQAAEETAETTPPEQAAPLEPLQPEAIAPEAVTETPKAKPETAQQQTPATSAQMAEPLVPQTPLAADAVPTIAALPPLETATFAAPKPDTPRPDTLTSEPPKETLSAREEPSPAPARSLRPQQRSAAFEQERKQVPPPKKVQKPAEKKAERGNSNQNAAAGTVSGTTAAQATTSGSADGQAAAAGTAAASNYPGLVMRKISAVPRPRSTSKGTAVVSFSITGGGGLGGVRIASSSGNARLDQAALRMVQRAAPFPAPPPGARRSFSISVKGR